MLVIRYINDTFIVACLSSSCWAHRGGGVGVWVFMLLLLADIGCVFDGAF